MRASADGRCPTPVVSSLVAPLRQRHVLERQRLLLELRRLSVARVLPRRDVCEMLVVALRLAVGRLVLDAEMPPARFLAVQRVDAHQLRQLEEIRDPTRLLEGLIQLLPRSGHAQVAPELRAQPGNVPQRRPEALGAARHATELPHELAELAMEMLARFRPADRE